MSLVPRIGCVFLFAAASAHGAAPFPRLDAYGDPLPPGPGARLGTVRFRTNGGCGAFAVSPDSKTVLTGEVGCVRQWDLSTGRPLRSFALDEYQRTVVFRVRFSPDGKRF